MNAPHLQNIIGKRISLNDKDKGEIDAWTMKYTSTYGYDGPKKNIKPYNFKKIKAH